MPWDHDDEKPDSLLFRYLRRWQRWLLGVLAAIMLSFGPYAILKGHDGLATSTYVLAGLVIAVVAISGVVPRRITYKDATIDFIVQERVRREVQTAVEEVADEVAGSDWASRIAWDLTEASTASATPAVDMFSRRLGQIRDFEDRSLAAIQEYAQSRGYEVRRADGSGDADCYLAEPSAGFEVAVVFKYTWSNDAVGRMTRFSMPRALFICVATPSIVELQRLANQRLGIQFAIIKMVPTMLDHAIANLRGEVSGPAVAALPGGGWYVSLPLED